MPGTAKRIRVRNVRRAPEDSFEYDDDGAVQIIEAEPRDATSQSNSIIGQLADHPTTLLVAPLVGAVGGAVAATAAIERLGVRREVATVGGAMIAFMAARNTSGVAKAVLGGVAIGGLSVGVVELLRTHRPEAIFGKQAAPAVEHRQAAPLPDAITRTDLVAAIADVQARNAAASVARDKAQLEVMEQMKTMIEDLVGKLRSAQSEAESLRAAAKAYDEERNATLGALGEATARAAQFEATIDSYAIAADDAQAAHVGSVEDSVSESGEAAPPVVANAGGAGAIADMTPDTVAHFQAISALLDDEDRTKLSTLVATMPKDVVEREQEKLATLPPADAVAYLRETVFPTLRVVA
jgi:hypothetical protein